MRFVELRASLNKFWTLPVPAGVRVCVTRDAVPLAGLCACVGPVLASTSTTYVLGFFALSCKVTPTPAFEALGGFLLQPRQEGLGSMYYDSIPNTDVSSCRAREGEGSMCQVLAWFAPSFWLYPFNLRDGVQFKMIKLLDFPEMLVLRRVQCYWQSWY